MSTFEDDEEYKKNKPKNALQKYNEMRTKYFVGEKRKKNWEEEDNSDCDLNFDLDEMELPLSKKDESKRKKKRKIEVKNEESEVRNQEMVEKSENSSNGTLASSTVDFKALQALDKEISTQTTSKSVLEPQKTQNLAAKPQTNLELIKSQTISKLDEPTPPLETLEIPNIEVGRLVLKEDEKFPGRFMVVKAAYLNVRPEITKTDNKLSQKPTQKSDSKVNKNSKYENEKMFDEKNSEIRKHRFESVDPTSQKDAQKPTLSSQEPNLDCEPTRKFTIKPFTDPKISSRLFVPDECPEMRLPTVDQKPTRNPSDKLPHLKTSEKNKNKNLVGSTAPQKVIKISGMGYKSFKLPKPIQLPAEIKVKEGPIAEENCDEEAKDPLGIPEDDEVVTENQDEKSSENFENTDGEF